MSCARPGERASCTEQGRKMSEDPIRPDIEKYPFQPAGKGHDVCQLVFRFNETAAPQTWVRALAVRKPTPEGAYSYELGIVNPHAPPDRGDQGEVIYLYPCADMKTLLDLPDAPESGNGCLGPFNAQALNDVLARLQALSMTMHHHYEKRQGEDIPQGHAPGLH